MNRFAIALFTKQTRIVRYHLLILLFYKSPPSHPSWHSIFQDNHNNASTHSVTKNLRFFDICIRRCFRHLQHLVVVHGHDVM